MEKTNLPFSLVFFIDSQISKECLSDIPSKDLIDLYRKEGSWNVRQAMAAELAKRSDILRIIKKKEFNII